MLVRAWLPAASPLQSFLEKSNSGARNAQALVTGHDMMTLRVGHDATPCDRPGRTVAESTPMQIEDDQGDQSDVSVAAMTPLSHRIFESGRRYFDNHQRLRNIGDNKVATP